MRTVKIFLRCLAEMLPGERCQMIRLVIRHLALPHHEDDLQPLRAERPQGLMVPVASSPVLFVVAPRPLALTQREEGQRMHVNHRP